MPSARGGVVGGALTGAAPAPARRRHRRRRSSWARRLLATRRRKRRRSCARWGGAPFPGDKRGAAPAAGDLSATPAPPPRRDEMPTVRRLFVRQLRWRCRCRCRSPPLAGQGPRGSPRRPDQAEGAPHPQPLRGAVRQVLHQGARDGDFYGAPSPFHSALRFADLLCPKRSCCRRPSRCQSVEPKTAALAASVALTTSFTLVVHSQLSAVGAVYDPVAYLYPYKKEVLKLV